MQNFLISTLFFLSLEALAETPKEFMHRYLEVWNQENVEKYEATFAIPHTRDYGGVLTIVDEPNISLVNFDEIKQSKLKIRIVGKVEINHQTDYISWISPLAKALIGKSVDDIIEIKTQDGERVYSILDIKY